jgi:23S rRNA pseudouridine1911/1915/1917 synthase
MDMSEFIEAPRILYACRECLVINKVPGESAEPAEAGSLINLPRILAAQFGNTEQAGGETGEPFMPAAVHRLDVPVSGCVLFARTPGALAALSASFAQGRVEKNYWALVEMPGTVPEERGELVHWIKTDTRRNKSTAYDEPGPGRKKALLRYSIRGRGIHYLFLEIELITGRHHQIRAQLAARGLHIKGDLKYGSRRSEKRGGIGLHSYSLSFPDPVRPERIIRVSGDPPFTDSLWDAFKNAGNPRAAPLPPV